MLSHGEVERKGQSVKRAYAYFHHLYHIYICSTFLVQTLVSNPTIRREKLQTDHGTFLFYDHLHVDVTAGLWAFFNPKARGNDGLKEHDENDRRPFSRTPSS